MAYLAAADRKAIPANDTAVPQKRTASGGAVSGSYPIPDISHARNALARGFWQTSGGAGPGRGYQQVPAAGQGRCNHPST